MHSTFAIAALAAVAYAAPRPQGVSENVSPEASAPAGCSGNQDGLFQIAAVNVTSTPSKRSLIASRQSSCGSEGSLTLKLADGILTDAQGRIGSIVANYQFQFDGPPAQAGAIYTAGFSTCNNGSLALGGSAVFYQCLSGGFYNLYDRSWAEQCNPVILQVLPCGGGSAPAPPNGVGAQPDGQPTGTAVGAPVTQIGDGQVQASTGIPPAPVSELSDGQPQVPTGLPVTQIGDGQIQAPTETVAPITQIGDGQIQAPTETVAPITQIGDGQIQAPTETVAPITQIGDGQIQAPTETVAPITQIGDGQIQAPTETVAPITQIDDGQIQAPTETVAPITQIDDGQIQAPTETVAPITQIGDGQIQAPTQTLAPITQIGDGQIQAPTSTAAAPTGGLVTQIGDGQVQTNATSTQVEFTGSAAKVGSSVGFFVAGLVGAVSYLL